MTKLHELLAVEGSLENQMNKCRTDLAGTFEKKRHLFEETQVTFVPSAEGHAPVVEAQSKIETTVRKELRWLSSFIVKALDASYQVAEANTLARADIELENGVVLARGVPATALLELEKRIKDIGDLLKSVPTLDPAKGFVLDPAREPGIYQALPVNKKRTKKTKEVIVKYPATKEFPAQTEMVDVDVPIGTLQELTWSGLLTPADKAELIDRAEMVGRAIRQARARANNVEVDMLAKIGKSLTAYILGDE